jgi:hypothetical protein
MTKEAAFNQKEGYLDKCFLVSMDKCSNCCENLGVTLYRQIISWGSILIPQPQIWPETVIDWVGFLKLRQAIWLSNENLNH